MNIDIGTPSEKQIQFLTAKKKHVGYGGARGGGKSWSVRTKAVLSSLKWDGLTSVIVRKSYPELYANHIVPFKELLHIGQAGNTIKYNDGRKEIRFPNGSRILFRYCGNAQDVDRFQGTECDIMYLDECTQLTEDQMKKLAACVRGVNGMPKRIYYTCNPGGVGHEYVKRIFLDKQYRDGENPEDYEFIQALVFDNKALMASNPDYIKQLEALPPKLREAWLYGRFDVFEGAYFEEFRSTPDLKAIAEMNVTVDEAKTEGIYTHVIRPFDVSKLGNDWSFYRSYDWGYGKPFSCAWWVVSPDHGEFGNNTIYRILELYGCTSTPNEGLHWTNKQQMDEIQRIEMEHPWLKGRRIEGVADPSIWDGSHDTYGISCAEEAEKHGLFFQKGNNERIAGWLQVHERLRFDQYGKARMYFFENCKAIIRCMPLMMYDEHKAEDLDTSLEDHCLDECRYMCMARPVAPRVHEEEYVPVSDPLNQYVKTDRYSIIRR